MSMVLSSTHPCLSEIKENLWDWQIYCRVSNILTCHKYISNFQTTKLIKDESWIFDINIIFSFFFLFRLLKKA